MYSTSVLSVFFAIEINAQSYTFFPLRHRYFVFNINHVLWESRWRFIDQTGKANPMYTARWRAKTAVQGHNTQQEKDVCHYLQHSMGLEATCRERVLPLACGIWTLKTSRTRVFFRPMSVSPLRSSMSEFRSFNIPAQSMLPKRKHRAIHFKQTSRRHEDAVSSLSPLKNLS